MEKDEQNQIFSLVPKEVCYESLEYLRNKYQEEIVRFEELKSSVKPEMIQTLTDIFVKYQQCRNELDELEDIGSMRDIALLYKTIRILNSEIIECANQIESSNKSKTIKIYSTIRAKMVLVGHVGSGKSSIMSKTFKNEFKEEYTSTIGVDFAFKIFKVGKHCIEVNLWDTSGQERFRTITNTYCRGSQAMIFVYDITDKNSLEELDKLVTGAKLYLSSSIPKILVGNKLDLVKNRQIKFEAAMKFAEKHELDYATEISCKSGFNIDQTIKHLFKIFVNIKR